MPDIPEGSILATPSEVAILGGLGSEIEQQRTLWDALPAGVLTEQVALSRELAEEFEPAFENMVDVPSVNARVSPSSCVASYVATAYKVAVSGYATQCFSGSAGTYTLTTPMKDVASTGNARIQACSHGGRVYYSLNVGYYWSTTRGPNDSTWRYFNIADDHIMTILKVQFL